MTLLHLIAEKPCFIKQLRLEWTAKVNTDQHTQGNPTNFNNKMTTEETKKREEERREGGVNSWFLNHVKECLTGVQF